MKQISTILILFLSITVFSQTNCDITNPSEGFMGGRQCSSDYDWTVANDIIIPADTDMTLTAIMPSIGMNSGVTVVSALVKVYNDSNGKPGGTAIASQTVTPSSHTYQGNGLGMDFSDVLFNLTPIYLSGSAGAEYRYWISIQVTTSNNTTAYMETTAATTVGMPIAFSGGSGFLIPTPHKDGVYTFFADCEPRTSEEFPFPYCGPLTLGTVEPITLVEVAGISNTSSATENGSPAHEDFVNVIGVMQRGITYPITLKGNTVDSPDNRFVVFIDWNQNNSLDDDGEVYVIAEVLNNSTGTDGQQVVGNISVPTDALLGTTRMRVKKTYEGPFIDPCNFQAGWGQTEDYTIEVGGEVGVSENNELLEFSYYPNPSSDIVYLQSARRIESVSLYNLFGQEVFSTQVTTEMSSIDVSNLSAGTYILKIITNGQMETYKVFKR